MEVDQSFLPFVHHGLISVPGGQETWPVTMLRDTACAQSLLLDGVIPPTCLPFDSRLTVPISGVGGVVEVPLNNLMLKSDVFSGPVTVGVAPSLPIKGVGLLLGNDILGGKVSHKENLASCATTRAMRAKQLAERDVQVDLSDSFIGRLFAELTVCDKKGDKISRSKLVEDQKNDSTLVSLFDKVSTEPKASGVSTNNSHFFLKNGILMRRWQPSDPDLTWQECEQIVVPSTYREDILKMAHEDPLAGHFGINKTKQRILRQFFWPSVDQDVRDFCKSCHSCQMVGKPNQKIPQAPLQPIPAFDDPFSHVIVDCVGPLPKSKKGMQYLLTIMCVSTRYVEAIPLRRITSANVVEVLVKFFTTVGLPRTIQTDQGSNFMSKIFKQVMDVLQVKHSISSAYHPESQGALERYHQTLKRMIKTYCLDTGKDWDQGIPLLLFAYRDTVQDSLGFSPFELVYGHEVRGPLKIFHETFLESSEESHILDHVSAFRERLVNATKTAHENLKSAQEKMKSQFDKRAVSRSFEPGEEVLVLLPSEGDSCLSSKYVGPYRIDQKLSKVNYLVHTPDRRKLKRVCHVNMLKKYFDREPKPAAAVGKPDDSMFDLSENIGFTLNNSGVLKNIDLKLMHLNASQQHDVKHLLYSYPTLFSDVPGLTTVTEHDIDVGQASPIKQHPYRVSPTKLQSIRSEVSYMQKHGIIEPSSSNWSSPCLLVPKSDGTVRFCTDYRKVNDVTKADNFPLPRVEDCIDRIGSAKFVSKFDLLKGYWQVPLTARAKEISACVTPDSLFQYKVMAFGMRNAPSTFQRLMNSVLYGLDFCRVYLDDVVVYSDTWESHIEHLRTLFERLNEAHLTVNLKKSDLGQAEVMYLGYVVGGGKVKPNNAKVEAIISYPVPRNVRELRGFLGMAGYYRKFCDHFSEVALPLTRLTSEKIPFIWSEDCQRAFQNLKVLMSTAPALKAPDFSQPFKLAIDASNFCVGAVLLQDDEELVEHPVAYYSKRLTPAQVNYATIEKEALSLLMALQHFEVYLSSEFVVTVYTDHNPLCFVKRMKNRNQRLLRWCLSLQEYNLHICHIRGKDNVLADGLSRIT